MTAVPMPEPAVFRFIDSGPCEAAFNMALDDALMETATDGLALRVYGWEPPAFSLGYFQPFSDLAEFEGVHPIVRRVTGGGAIFHANELTYSITCRVKSGSAFSSIPGTYELVHGVLSEALEELGFSVGLREDSVPDSDIDDTGFCFYRSVGVDVMRGNRKLIGSAQRRSRGKLLMHGSVVIGKNPVTPETACLTGNPGEVPLLYSKIRDHFRRALERALSVQLSDATPCEAELQIAARLVRGKFANPEWTRRR